MSSYKLCIFCLNIFLLIDKKSVDKFGITSIFLLLSESNNALFLYNYLLKVLYLTD